MPCYHPLRGYRRDDGSVAFAERGSDIHSSMLLPCGQCIGCRIEKAQMWSIRCMHENKMHKQSCFATFTYTDEWLPERGQLVYRDFQLMMKRLRKSLDKPVRFYMAGEYGEQTWRPHFHALLFGYRPVDMKYWSKATGNKGNLYESPSLESIWGLGRVLIGDVTYQSANYVARYCLKKVTGVGADEYYSRVDLETGEIYQLQPEFNQMSRKPGIGATYIEKYSNDVYQSDSVIINGKEAKVPKYYDRWFKENFPDEYAEIQLDRMERSRKHLADQSWQRLEVKEEVAAASLTFKQRNSISDS